MKETLTKEDVLKIKEQIERKEKEAIQKETKLEQANEYVKTTYNCSSLKEVESRLDESDKKLEDFDKKIEEKSKELSESYAWDI